VAYLPPVGDDDTSPAAFDTGPANVLIDVVMTILTDGAQSYDEDGRVAASGSVDEAWIAELLTLPYYQRPPPKTTGRELYSPAMGAELLSEGRERGLSDADIVATLTAYSAESVIDQFRRFLAVPPDEVIVAGGGTRNPVLMARLAAGLPDATFMTFEDVGYASHQKEAIAMAVLAYETWMGRPGALPAFSGVGHPVLMGTIAPGRLSHIR
jgi:anhydro-N-acetylmuramic acid kinase